MASDTTSNFFLNGTSKQFDYVLKLYPKVLKMKADIRSKKPDELIKLDDWYQNELPRLIKKRGKDAHMVHEELVQTMKWKQSRGKFYPQLSYLIKVNTPRAVMLETKKAFKKLPNLEQAITALSNLKGVGTTMASALLAAASPENAPFMADECLMAIPEIEGIDYTTKEYLNFVEHIQSTVRRLNAEKDRTASGAPDGEWSPHRVELAMWTHYVARELKPELLDDIPPHTTSTNGTSNNAATVTTAATTTTTTDDEEEDLEFEDQNVKVIKTKVPEGQNLDNTDDDSSSNLVDSTSTIPVLAKNGENGNHKLSPSSSPLPPTTNGILLDISCHNPAAATLKIDENSTTTTTTTRSDDDDSIDNNKSITPIIVANDETNDSDSQSSAKRSLDCEESSTSEEQTDDLRSGEPQIKKIKADN